MESRPLLDEQIEYYQAVANEYEDHAIESTGGDELFAAVDQFAPTGDVLDLACGFGAWTERLLMTAASVTAVDASSAMLARAAKRLAGSPVRFVESDIFDWRPDRRYDAVFFGFWLSHVPDERFDSFWRLVADCLKPGAPVLFVDDNHRSAAELIEGPDSVVVERRLNDGTAHRAIKVPHTPAELQRRLRSLGWNIDVHPAGDHFYWGTGVLDVRSLQPQSP